MHGGISSRTALRDPNRKQPTVTRRPTNRVIVAALVGFVAMGAGSAAALWSSSGVGSGNNKALTATTVTVNAVTGSADLYPGFSGGKVNFSLTNANPYPVTFTSMTPGTVTSSNEGACPAANVSVNTASGLLLAVGGSTTSATLSIPGVVTLASTAGDGCQGIVFTIALTLTGSQV